MADTLTLHTVRLRNFELIVSRANSKARRESFKFSLQERETLDTSDDVHTLNGEVKVQCSESESHNLASGARTTALPDLRRECFWPTWQQQTVRNITSDTIWVKKRHKSAINVKRYSLEHQKIYIFKILFSIYGVAYLLLVKMANLSTSGLQDRAGGLLSSAFVLFSFWRKVMAR